MEKMIALVAVVLMVGCNSNEMSQEQMQPRLTSEAEISDMGTYVGGPLYIRIFLDSPTKYEVIWALTQNESKMSLKSKGDFDESSWGNFSFGHINNNEYTKARIRGGLEPMSCKTGQVRLLLEDEVFNIESICTTEDNMAYTIRGKGSYILECLERSSDHTEYNFVSPENCPAIR